MVESVDAGSSGPGLTLDHCGCIAVDLQTTAAAWERLGFTLCPESPQRGAVPGLEGMHPWATANRCALFEHGYLELIGVARPGAWNPWAQFMARGPGLHILALRCDNADSTYAALADTAPFLQPPVQREREVDVDGALQKMRFRNIFSRDSDCPEARHILIEHQTPDYLWQRRYLSHDNGACELRSATVVADDPAGVAARMEAIGAPASVEVIDAAAFVRRYGYRPARLPGLQAVCIGVRHLGDALALLHARGVPVESGTAGSPGIWIAPQHTGGFAMNLVQAETR
jgi:hypothetical protein